jgi:ubiquinone/menaquinone biosynthesis C-methylase UbiE
MGVASHLGIDLADYDRRIRTFIPDYEEMLDAAAAAVPPRARRIVDLGTGTGALAARCLARADRASVLGIDSDADILALAARRLSGRATFLSGSFLRATIPPCDAVVTSFALHHVRTIAAKARLYRRVRRALGRRGRFIGVDCQPSRQPAFAQAQLDAWRAHLRRTYSTRAADGFLRAWSREDVYVPLDSEIALMARARLRVELLWRKGAFAVLAASPTA